MARRRGYALSIIGPPGAGKTEFSLRGTPRPTWLIHMDENTRAIVDKLKRRGEGEGIVRKAIIPPALAFDERDDIKEEAIGKWDEFRDYLRPLIKGEDQARAVVFDTATELFNLGPLSAFGKSDQIPPEVRRNMMGPIYSRWKGITAALVARGINVILIHRGKEKWEDVTVETERGTQDQRRRMTGPFDWEREGYNGTGFMVSTEIVLTFDETRASKTIYGKYGMKIIRCQQRPGLIGREYWGRETIDGQKIRKASWPYLSMLLYPDTKLEDWQ